MKIEKFEARNYKGLTDYTLIPKKLNVFCGANGSGKTSVISALNYAITGEENGHIIRKGCDEAATNISFEDGTNVIRLKDKVNHAWVNKKSCTLSTANEIISKTFDGIPVNEISLALSTGKIFSMKPQELSDLLLSYTNCDVTLETIQKILPSLTENELKALSYYLPETFDISDIEKAEAKAKEDRRLLKAKVKELETILKIKPDYESIDVASLEAELDLINKKDAERAAYDIKLSAYKEALRQAESINNLIEHKNSEIASIKVSDTLEDDLAAMSEYKQARLKMYEESKFILNTIENSLSSLTKSLELLNTPRCPLSDKLTCTVDKNPIRDELENAISDSKTSFDIQKATVNALNDELAEASEDLNALMLQKAAKEKKETLQAQVNELTLRIPSIPEKPEELVFEDLTEKRAEIMKKMAAATTVEEYKKKQSAYAKMASQLATLESIVKLLSPKAAIKTSIISEYTHFFNEELNATAQKLNKDVKVQTVADNGIVVLFDFKNGFIPYQDLSNGEKLLATYIMAAMLDELIGTKLLIIDELSILDKASYKTLLEILKADEHFDHIFIANTDNSDFTDICRELNIEIDHLAA